MRTELRRGRGTARRDEGSQGTGSELSRNSSSVRGQAHVIGFVLLIGVVTVASVGIVVIGSDVLDTQQTAIETEYAEQSMIEFARRSKTVTTDRSPAGVSIGPFDRGRIEVQRDTGRVTITSINNSGGRTVLYDEPFGSLIYANEDTEIAYQGRRRLAN